MFPTKMFFMPLFSVGRDECNRSKGVESPTSRQPVEFEGVESSRKWKRARQANFFKRQPSVPLLRAMAKAIRSLCRAPARVTAAAGTPIGTEPRVERKTLIASVRSGYNTAALRLRDGAASAGVMK